jgi:hypothetical protein
MLINHIIDNYNHNNFDNENEIEIEILNIYNNYYNKNGKLKNHMINDFIFHQVEIVKRILHISTASKHLDIAFKFAQQLV